MLNYNIHRAKAAVQYLVDTSYYAHHTRKLRSAIARPRVLPFKGEAEVLNELVIIGRQSLAAFENLLALAEFKRDDHNDYQRKFMAAKRARERRVIAIQEAMLQKTLSLDERRAVLLEQYETWNKEKEAHIQQSAEAFRTQFDEEPGWEQRNQFIKEFWALKDMELDMMLDAAEKIKAKLATPKKKRVVVNQVENAPLRNTILAEKLQKIVNRKK